MEIICIKNLNELEDYGYVILDKENSLTNNIKKLLTEKGLSQSDLAVLSGISKQNISDIVQNKLKPGVDFALKIAKVLDVSVEELFELNDSAWCQIAKTKEGLSLFLDVYDMKIIDNNYKKFLISTGEYISLKENRCISKAEYDERLRKFIKGNENKSLTRKDLIKLFEENVCSKRFKKLGKKIIVLSNNN